MKIRLAVLSFLFFVVLSGSAMALDFPAYEDKYVNDFAGIFSVGQAAMLRSLFMELERNTTAEVVAATVENLSGMAPSQYATDMFNAWHIGKKGSDNGLLVLYAKAENKIWVATGYGLEGALPDSKIGRMLDEYYVPARDAGQPGKGIIDFAQAVAAVIQNEGLTGQPTDLMPPEAVIFLFLLVVAFIIPAIYAAKKSSRKCEVCGLKMKLMKTESGIWGTDEVYHIYECPNGHRKKVKASKNHGVFVFSGGFGGGSFGGGFGGGASGGGGAGR